MDLLDLARDPLTSANDLADAVSWCSDPAALPVVLLLAQHPDASVRRSVAQALPRLTSAPRPPAVVTALIGLSTDAVGDIRDWASYALGTQLADVNTPELRDALAARLDDPDPNPRCEALLGLARRRDPRALPAVRVALDAEYVRLPEIQAAGALGDPSLHVLVRAQLAGWGPAAVRTVCGALRLTDPDGVGEDLFDGLAAWFASPESATPIADRYWWSIALGLLDQAEHRGVEIAEAVRVRLLDDGAGTERLLISRLAAVAGKHGWSPGF